MLKYLTLFSLSFVLILSGCTNTQQARNVHQSGFLDDYSILKRVKGKRALLSYRKPFTSWRKYNQIIIDPVVIFMDRDSKFAKLDRKTRQKIVNRFHMYLSQEFSQVMKVTNNPGHRTLRLQVALTDVQSSNPIRDTLSHMTPPGIATGLLGRAITGEPTNVGSVSVEVKMLNSATGELLAAAVDRRAGSKKLGLGLIDKWDDVDNILQFWSKQSAYKICLATRSTQCVEPKP